MAVPARGVLPPVGGTMAASKARTTKARATRAAPPEHDLEALESGLAEALPELQVLDREVELEGESRAELVGVDTLGHLVLVLVVDGAEESCVPQALDALAFARRNAELLARHLDSPRLQPGLPPRVVLVAQTFAPLVKARLAPLSGREAELFELRTLRSRSGEHAYLIAASTAEAGPSAIRNVGPEVLVGRLPVQRRKVAERLVASMQRMDEELDLTVAGNRLVWHLGDDVVAWLELESDGLRGSIPPEHEPLQVAGGADVDAFVGAAMGRYAALLSSAEAGPPGAGADGDGGEEALEVELGEGGILTPEEIEAFRD